MNIYFRQYIEEKRQALGFSQRDLSRKLQLSPSWYTKFVESDIVDLKLSTFVALANILGESPHQLLDIYLKRGLGAPLQVDTVLLEKALLDVFAALPMEVSHRLQARFACMVASPML
jgi:transcriptional regulator with XRE-family HTH domain